MRATTPPRRPPAGFTLVELLVVISIIGILMGLLLGAVQKVREVGKRTTTVTEINQIDMAATKFKLDFGFNPPHRIRLPGVIPTAAWESSTNQFERESFAGFKLLLQMFPRWQLPSSVPAIDAFNSGSNVGTTPTDIKYCSTLATPSVVGVNSEGLLLEGSQCLVFFVGGPELQGFKPSGPYDATGAATSRKGPYYDFKADRLNPSADARTSLPSGLVTATVAVPKGYLNGYLDPYGVPYAYFSTSGGRGYDPSYAWSPPGSNVMPASGPPSNPPYDYVANTSAATPLFVVRPYQEAANKWINADRCQIISAGKNKRFGPGTEGDFQTATGLTVSSRWTVGGPYYALDSDIKPKLKVPAGTPPYTNGDGVGGDDLTNFNAGTMLGSVGN